MDPGFGLPDQLRYVGQEGRPFIGIKQEVEVALRFAYLPFVQDRQLVSPVFQLEPKQGRDEVVDIIFTVKDAGHDDEDGVFVIPRSVVTAFVDINHPHVFIHAIPGAPSTDRA